MKQGVATSVFNLDQNSQESTVAHEYMYLTFLCLFLSKGKVVAVSRGVGFDFAQPTVCRFEQNGRVGTAHHF